MLYVAGWLSSSDPPSTLKLNCGVWFYEKPCTVDNQLKNAADQQSPFHHANYARHRLSKSGYGLNMWVCMWVCTSCSPPPPPNPMSPDKTLTNNKQKLILSMVLLAESRTCLLEKLEKVTVRSKSELIFQNSASKMANCNIVDIVNYLMLLLENS